ncbi:branched-chain alpha-ketoacid dehydrogenase [Pilobolus umbonatus]|nr:branched-chain alpha-ketoacid dehydrogenase [Pilobolus umbonatus]
MNKTLDTFLAKDPTPLTLRQLLFYERHCNKERLLKSANYVRLELPIRLAHRIREFQKLPYILGTNPHIQQVYDLYWQSFDKIRRLPEISTTEDNEYLCEILSESLGAHLVVIPQLAIGIRECEDSYSSVIPVTQLDRFMNDTLRSRISRRVLAEHHLVLSKKKESIFNPCSSQEMIIKCIQLVESHLSHLSMQKDGSPMPLPKIELDGMNTEFIYVSDHIEYIMYQLLSNAIRHTMENRQGNKISITLSSNNQDVLFRISDTGGGIFKDKFEHIWSYGYQKQTGEMEQVQKLEGKIKEDDVLVKRLGIGLPMSRVYAEYWGGNINLVTMEGYGTDAYVRIPRLGNQIENISYKSVLDEVIM